MKIGYTAEQTAAIWSSDIGLSEWEVGFLAVALDGMGARRVPHGPDVFFLTPRTYAVKLIHKERILEC